MALLYITGAPGAGKTTLQRALTEHGYDARDLDNSHLGGPHNKASGLRVVIPPVDQRSPEWFEAHEWRVYPDAMKALKLEASDRDILLCGVAASDGEVLHLFDKILYLKLDDETLRQRIESRIDNDFGKNDFELLQILERKHGLDMKYSSLDVIEIDAEKSLDEVVDVIASHLS
jgi:adenylate kinase family enzyme